MLLEPSPGLGNICEGSLRALLTRVYIILFWPSGWLLVCMERVYEVGLMRC